MSSVDDALIALFRSLVSGKAAWPLYLFGPVGTGKTRAALCLCDFAARSAAWTIEEMIDIEMNGDRDEKQKTRERLANHELILLDELGEREKVGDLYLTTLKRVLDLRERHQGRRAIYASNLSPQKLAELLDDDRVVSRLVCGTIFLLDGPDRRNKGAAF